MCLEGIYKTQLLFPQAQMENETSPPSVLSHLDFYINQESLMHRRLNLVFLNRVFFKPKLIVVFLKAATNSCLNCQAALNIKVG